VSPDIFRSAGGKSLSRSCRRILLRQAEFAARQFGVDVVLVCDDAHTYCLTTEERFDYVLLLGTLQQRSNELVAAEPCGITGHDAERRFAR
jgi:hypothetical protein